MAYIGKKPSDITRAIATNDTFTGDGSTTTFTLSQGAASANDITVVVNNVRQEPGASKSYTLTAPTSLVFNVAPASADEIYVINPTQVESVVRAGDVSDGIITNAKLAQDLISGETAETSVANDDTILMFDESASALRKITKSNFSPAISLSYTAGTATGDGSTTVFTINSGRAVADVLVIVNGVVLVPTTDYTISGTNLTFATAPGASAEIQFRYLPIEG
jgi:roadblock/LC7 domain-containing protein